MIDEIRAAAMPRTPPVRLDTATELAGFGSALGTAIGLRSASPHAGPETSPQIDRQVESQQMDKTLKARRMFDKRVQNPMTAASQTVPNRTPETSGNRSANAAQPSDRIAQQRAEAQSGKQRPVQREGRQADPSAASAARDETTGSSIPATLADAPPGGKPREKANATQEEPALASVPGFQGQTPQTIPAPAAQPAQDATLAAATNAEAALDSLSGAPNQAAHLPDASHGDRLPAHNQQGTPLNSTTAIATSAPAPQKDEAAKVSVTDAQAGTMTPRSDTNRFAAQTLETRGSADGQAASPLRLAIARSEAPDMIAMTAAQTTPPGNDETRARPDAKHTLRESLAQQAIVEWRPQSPANETSLSSQGDDGQSARRLLDAINGMRQATASAPPGEPDGSSFAASLANAAASGPSPQPADATAVPLANPWPLQDPEFQTHLAGQVGEALMAGLERAEITVSPRELGPIKIELALSGENASVAFSAAHPDTREAIERSLPTLETMLAEHGLTLSHSSVSEGAQQNAGRQAGRESPAPAAPIDADRSGARLPVSGDSPRPAQAARGLLDLFA